MVAPHRLVGADDRADQGVQVPDLLVVGQAGRIDDLRRDRLHERIEAGRGPDGPQDRVAVDRHDGGDQAVPGAGGGGQRLDECADGGRVQLGLDGRALEVRHLLEQRGPFGQVALGLHLGGHVPRHGEDLVERIDTCVPPQPDPPPVGGAVAVVEPGDAIALDQRIEGLEGRRHVLGMDELDEGSAGQLLDRPPEHVLPGAAELVQVPLGVGGGGQDRCPVEEATEVAPGSTVVDRIRRRGCGTRSSHRVHQVVSSRQWSADGERVRCLAPAPSSAETGRP